MLSIGKLLTEEQGRLTVRRVLSVDGGSAKVETTWESAGTFNGVHYTDLGTLWSFIRPDGTLYGEWKGGLRTDNNETSVYTEVMIQHTGLSAAGRGYDVQVVIDACGALSSRTEDAALRRLAQAGVTITSTASIAAQLMGDLTQSPKAAEALKLLLEISMAA